MSLEAWCAGCVSRVSHVVEWLVDGSGKPVAVALVVLVALVWPSGKRRRRQRTSQEGTAGAVASESAPGTTPPPTADPAPPTGNRRDLRRDEPEPTPAADSVVAEPASEPAATTEEPAPVEPASGDTPPGPGREEPERTPLQAGLPGIETPPGAPALR